MAKIVVANVVRCDVECPANEHVYVFKSKSKRSAKDDIRVKNAGKSLWGGRLAGRYAAIPRSALRAKTNQELGTLFEAVVIKLARAGVCVNWNPTANFSIYVVEIDCNRLGISVENLLYVGLTSKLPDERIAEHVAGIRPARFAKYFGRRREDLEPDELLPKSKWNGEVQESLWGRELERRGYTVVGPHGFSSQDFLSRFSK